jgi:hypothetical protein
VVEGNDRGLITFFTIPKAWEGDAAQVQENAVRSWIAVGARVILFGDDPGVPQAAARLGAQHIAEVSRNELGTPLLDRTFARAHEMAPDSLLCFANTDIVVGHDFRLAAERANAILDRFLMVGESWDTEVTGTLAFEPGWDGRLPRGRKRGAGALDWFLFTHGIFESIPPFAVGRAAFDNWLVWRARDAGATVVDATRSVHVVHQMHGYAHVTGGFGDTRSGSEAAENWRLIGSKRRVFTRFDATHLLTPQGLRRNLGATLRAKERGRKLIWKLRHGQLRPARVPR